MNKQILRIWTTYLCLGLGLACSTDQGVRKDVRSQGVKATKLEAEASAKAEGDQGSAPPPPPSHEAAGSLTLSLANISAQLFKTLALHCGGTESATFGALAAALPTWEGEFTATTRASLPCPEAQFIGSLEDGTQIKAPLADKQSLLVDNAQLDLALAVVNDSWQVISRDEAKKAILASRTPLVVDVQIITGDNGGNEMWDIEFTKKILRVASDLLDNEVVLMLGSYKRVANERLYNGPQAEILNTYAPETARPGRFSLTISGPNATDSYGCAPQGNAQRALFAPFAVAMAHKKNRDDYTAAIILHELSHTMGHGHAGEGERLTAYPFNTDGWWTTSVSRQAAVRLARWSQEYLMEAKSEKKAAELFTCKVGAPVPTEGAFPPPSYRAPEGECAERCARTQDCKAYYRWTDSDTCVLLGPNVGKAGQGWGNIEVCHRKGL